MVKIGDWEGVLRRPPMGPVEPKAHDMLRKANLLRWIHPVFPLAPKPYVSCSDTTILGVPFYMVERRISIAIMPVAKDKKEVHIHMDIFSKIDTQRSPRPEVDVSQGRSIASSRSTTTRVMEVLDANQRGNVHGGVIMLVTEI